MALLIFFWTLYYVIHSVLAASPVKLFFERKLGKYFRYYRLAYSVFATITLLALLLYQYSFDSPLLNSWVVVKYGAFMFLVLPGAVIMTLAIKKYFLLLSGVRSLFEPTPPVELKVEGIHRFTRHPLYGGTILFVWGLFFIFPMLSNLVACVLLTLYVLVGIVFEEKKLNREFGEKYEKYKMDVPMLIPGFKMKK